MPIRGGRGAALEESMCTHSGGVAEKARSTLLKALPYRRGDRSRSFGRRLFWTRTEDGAQTRHNDRRQDKPDNARHDGLLAVERVRERVVPPPRRSVSPVAVSVDHQH